MNIASIIRLACVWEVTARKAGNVHPDCSFPDLTFDDFVRSADAIMPIFAGASSQPVGDTILEAIRATRSVVASNTNLGIVLLLAPLAAVKPDDPLQTGVIKVLMNLTVDDAKKTYEAIRLAQPGGMGKVENQDIDDSPTLPLREAMVLAEDRDLIARQYANGFVEVFESVAYFEQYLARFGELERAIVGTHLMLMSRHHDSLIARKLGQAEAGLVRNQAKKVLDAGWPDTTAGLQAFRQLDHWLRDPARRRNPGTTADLVAACLFAALRTGIIKAEDSIPWSLASHPG